jgi:hypothetical protein
MPRPSRSATRRKKIANLFGGFSLAACTALMAYGQEVGTSRPSGDQVRTDRDPLRARSATENVVFGQIVSTDDHRLTLREGEGDAVTETTYKLSPTVTVHVRDRQINLKDLPASARVRFPRVTVPDAEITDLYVVEDPADVPAATSATEVSPDATRVVENGESPTVSNDVVPPVKLGATLETTTQGVEIIRLDPISPLGDAGMKAGDFIKMAAGQSVVTPEGLFRVLNEFDGGTTVELVAMRTDNELEFTVKLPEDHKKVLVDADETQGPVRTDLATATPRGNINPRLLQQIRQTQEQQQAQLKYLYDSVLQLANAAGVNRGIFGNYPYAGGVLPVGVGIGDGSGTGSGQCFGAIGFDSNGNPVIGFTANGTAIGVLSFNADGVPILGETTLVTPVDNGGNGADTTDLNNDGIPDETEPDPTRNEVQSPFPSPPAEPPFKALEGAAPRTGAPAQPGVAPATPRPRRSAR